MSGSVRKAGRPRRGQPTLDHQQIGEATVEILKTHGTQALTFAEVARKLGIRSQTLYYHASTVADLVNAARGVLVSAIDTSWSEADSWTESVVQFADEYYLCFRPLAHANTVFFVYPITDPLTLQTYEKFLATAASFEKDQEAALQLLLDVEHVIFAMIFEQTSWESLFCEEAIVESGATTLQLLLSKRQSREGSTRKRLHETVRFLAASTPGQTH
jgi:AcrR family transcriptional regulator